MTISELKNILACRGLAACVGLAAYGLTFSCGGGRDAVRDDYLPPPERPKEKPVGAAPECVDDKGETVECEEDSECCSGFVCSKDPELSPRKKYCVYAGQ